MDGQSSPSPSPDTVFLEACDIYFRHCHNKPYGFFNATLFHQKVQNDQVPLHLRLALIASATRYSSRAQWMEKKQSTIDSYARCSWDLITTSTTPLDESDDVDIIQSLAILAVIDATAGRRRNAWVKIGMSVRIAQDLNMMLEPTSNLPELERDERRNLFWSLYLLDRFVCCSFGRPPAINDSDCLLNLPTHYRAGKRLPSISLSELFNERIRGILPRSGMFGISIGLAACLGRTTKYMMGKSDATSPWTSHSEYCAIYRDLEYLKELAVKNGPVLAAQLEGQHRRQSDTPSPDREQIAHMVLSHTIYHLAHCILSHPFLIGLKVDSDRRSDMPSTWLEETRKRSLAHAESLIAVLIEAKAAGYMPVPSVYSYCMLLASTIHALFLYIGDSSVCHSSAEYLKTSLEYLADMSELWDNAQIMANALKSFIVQCPRYSDILLRTGPRVSEFTQNELAILRSVLDYWSMMDPRNPVFEGPSSVTCQLADIRGMSLSPLSSLTRSQTPLSPAKDDTLGVSTSSFEHKESDVDSDILISYPLSVMSPMGSDDESSKWDWDSELDYFKS
ncbi:uncharacterized protein N7483_007091 [Penicillium malachiteum]|uniref:uncharacterized protein n=1 Tax=Penicillium malachiteum TaxID=1324776 RepID=UPI0025475F7C|nr:uncharacterized protein N7483_007091 [Penicillium malachiteum]KAJ5725734.1 hypothetical protein N7483_007091 [Penicillium malachiteum]